MSPLDAIERQLAARFAQAGPRGRVVIWVDPEAEYASQVDLLGLPGVTVLHVAGNEFEIKRRVLSAEPRAKFLIYRPEPSPSNRVENWLLDLELAYGLFTTDSTSLVVQEFGSGDSLREVVERYPAFFKTAERNAALKARLDGDDDQTDITAKMVAVIVGSDEHSLDALWRSLLIENASGKSAAMDEIRKLGLADFHWGGTRRIYGYDSESPTVDDFALWLFARAWERFASTTPNEFRNIQRDFSTWRNDLRFATAYRVLADRAAEGLDISSQAKALRLPDLMPRFTFREADHQIIGRLVQGVESRTLLDKDVQEMVRRRGAGTWYPEFHHHYVAVAAASTALTLIEALSVSVASPAEGFRRYTEEWFAIDQAYRQFTWHRDRAEPNAPLEPLKPKIEAFYTTKYLKPLGDSWQRQVDSLDRWQISGVPAASSFFAEQVRRPWLDKKGKVVVVISDALRYEVAEELGRRIRAEDRFEAGLTGMMSVFPSYTQLGMAALLPHETLAFTEGDKSLVEIDGRPSDGTARRAKILESSNGTAVQASTLLSMSQEESRELVKTHQVLYVYHNEIDMAGDKVATEGAVFRACEDAIEELVKVVKKLANANVNNVLITADHGFLYQETPLEESEYLSEKPHANTLLFTNHRFVLGHGLKRDPAFTTFTPDQLGLVGEVEAEVPKSIHRLRMPGSGVRYVHGGATLQEIVVPVLAVNKRRASDTRPVAVKVMAETDRITTGQVTIMLYQEEAVTEKVKARTLIAGLYAGETLVSDEVTVACSQTSSEKRDRFFPVNLVLSKQADEFNGQAVELRLCEPVGTSQRRPYPDKARFTLVRTFTSDFDF
jgi:uncharacterized protein (TIGR02687 family)